MNSEIIQIALRVIGVLEDLQIPYHVGGSFASSLHGVPRQTRDLDLVIDLPLSLVPLFAARFQVSSTSTPRPSSARFNGAATSISST